MLLLIAIYRPETLVMDPGVPYSLVLFRKHPRMRVKFHEAGWLSWEKGCRFHRFHKPEQGSWVIHRERVRSGREMPAFTVVGKVQAGKRGKLPGWGFAVPAGGVLPLSAPFPPGRPGA
jgi:hypothetical protein